MIVQKKSQAKRNRTDKKKKVGVNATHQESDSNLETILSVHRADENILIKGKNQWWHVFCTLQCQIVKHVARQTKSIPPPLHCQNSTWKSWYFVFPIEFCDLHFIFYMFVYLCHHLFTFAIRQQQEFQGSKVARFEVSRVRTFRADFAWFASVLPVPTNTAREKNVFQKMCVFPDFLSAKPTIWCMLYTLGKIYIDLMMNSGFVLEIQSLSFLSKPNLLFNVHQNDFKIWPCVLFIWRALCSVTRLVHIPSSSPTKNRTLLNCILEIAHIMRGWHVNCVDTHGQEIRCPNLKVI